MHLRSRSQAVQFLHTTSTTDVAFNIYTALGLLNVFGSSTHVNALTINFETALLSWSWRVPRRMVHGAGHVTTTVLDYDRRQK